MALVLEASLVNRDDDKIRFTLEGTLDGTPSNTSIVLTFEDGSQYAVDVAPELIPLPIETPFSFILLSTSIGKDKFEDGVYSFDFTIEYSDFATQVLERQYLLFKNNTVDEWVKIMSRHIGMDCISSNEPSIQKRSNARELIQSAEEYFFQEKYNEASTALSVAMEILKTC